MIRGGIRQNMERSSLGCRRYKKLFRPSSIYIVRVDYEADDNEVHRTDLCEGVHSQGFSVEELKHEVVFGNSRVEGMLFPSNLSM